MKRSKYHKDRPAPAAPRGRQSAPAKTAPNRKPGERPLKTLERVISKAGLGSRTDACGWIAAGRVKVNGKAIQDPGHWVDLERDRVTMDGKPVAAAEKSYLLLYKPKGYLTTARDPQGRPTVYQLLHGVSQWVFPVGRLDLDTSGLLLMTNDSQFAERMTNPEFKVPKTYLVKSQTRLTSEQLDRLRQGVDLKDGPTRPAQVVWLRDAGNHTFFEITITEGRNRQVRRMLEAIESKVSKLVRIAIGPITIASLPIGRWRQLASAELHALQAAGAENIRPQPPGE